MVLLWKDPSGERATSIKKSAHGSPPPKSNSKEAEKIATLEKVISEKDLEIAKLKDQLDTLKEAS